MILVAGLHALALLIAGELLRGLRQHAPGVVDFRLASFSVGSFGVAGRRSRDPLADLRRLPLLYL